MHNVRISRSSTSTFCLPRGFCWRAAASAASRRPMTLTTASWRTPIIQQESRLVWLGIGLASRTDDEGVKNSRSPEKAGSRTSIRRSPGLPRVASPVRRFPAQFAPLLFVDAPVGRAGRGKVNPIVLTADACPRSPPSRLYIRRDDVPPASCRWSRTTQVGGHDPQDAVSRPGLLPRRVPDPLPALHGIGG